MKGEFPLWSVLCLRDRRWDVLWIMRAIMLFQMGLTPLVRVPTQDRGVLLRLFLPVRSLIQLDRSGDLARVASTVHGARV